MRNQGGLTKSWHPGLEGVERNGSEGDWGGGNLREYTDEPKG